MIESLYSPQKAPIFKETFVSEQTTRANGGVPTSVTYSSGIGSFNGTTSLINYALKLRGTYSVRIRFKSISSYTNYIMDARTSSGTGYIYSPSANTLGVSSGTVYVNGVATTTYNSSTLEIVVTGIALVVPSVIRFFSDLSNTVLTTAEVELIEIYDYTLTANEVANLYVGKRYNELEYQRVQPSEQYGINPSTTGSYSTPKALTQTDTLEFIGKIDFTVGGVWSGYAVGTFDNGTTSRSFYVTYSAGKFGLIYGSGLSQTVLASTTTTIYNGWVRVTIEKSGSDSLIKFYKSDESNVTDYTQVTWTQIGTTVTGTYAAMVTTSSFFNVLSGGNTSNASRANCYYAHMAETIGGTPLAVFNPANYQSGTTFVTNGDTWTINGTATIYQGVTEILNVDVKNGAIQNKWNSTITNTNTAVVRDGNVWAMDFSTTSSNVNCGSYDTLVGNKTLIMWVKPWYTTSTTGSFDAFKNGQFALQADYGGSAAWYFSRTYFSGTYISAANTITENQWQMMVVTSTSNGVSIMYKNAVSIASGTVTTPVAGTNMLIGNGASVGKSRISGVRVLNGILTAQEISQLFSNERRNYGV